MELRQIAGQVEQLRREKDRFFRESHNSPIPEEDRHSFSGLEYFPFSDELVFETELVEMDSPAEVVMATSVAGEEALYHRVGHFEFEVGGTLVRLYAYRSAHEHEHGRPSLFIPFRDATSGKESYGAARYLEVEVSPSGRYLLNFNVAYNPYCAYSDRYICPLPPTENWLEVPIYAGERNYSKA